MSYRLRINTQHVGPDAVLAELVLKVVGAEECSIARE